MEDNGRIEKDFAINQFLADKRIGSYTQRSLIKLKIQELAKRKKVMDNFLKKEIIEEEYNLVCFLCNKLMYKPVSLNCGHSFCYLCINNFLQQSSSCPKCSSYISKRRITKCLNLGNMVEKLRNAWDHRSHRFQLRIENEAVVDDNIRGMKVTHVEPGDRIDVRDTGNIWCVAEVLKVMPSSIPGESPIVKVHYFGWNKMYDEFLKLNSSRIRPLGYYTSKAHIPHYADLTSTSDLFRSRVVREGATSSDAEAFSATHFAGLFGSLYELFNQQNINNEVEDEESYDPREHDRNQNEQSHRSENNSRNEEDDEDEYNDDLQDESENDVDNGVGDSIEISESSD